jgi:hypothetical protein
MLRDSDPGTETRAIALVSLGLVFSLITHLHKKGLIPNIDTEDLFEGVLKVLENFHDANDPAFQTARQLVDYMALILATDGTFFPKPDRT